MRIGEGMWTTAKKLHFTPSAITEAEIQSQTKDGSFHVLDEDYRNGLYGALWVP